jgi:hypothetical protein
MNKRGQKAGAQRGDRRRFPYESRLIGGKLYLPAELQNIHQAVLALPSWGASPTTSEPWWEPSGLT